MKQKIQQMAFEIHTETLPLFSGSPMKGTVETFDPSPAARQLPMSCPVCYGVGRVYVSKKWVNCPCRLQQ
jgi:hypothetical protein